MEVLTVLLWIGKVLLLLLLLLVALLLLAMAVVLVASFFYEVEAKKDETVFVKGSFRWLFGAVKVAVCYEGDNVETQVRLLGRTTEEWAHGKKKKKKNKKKKQKKKKAQSSGKKELEPEHKTLSVKEKPLVKEQPSIPREEEPAKKVQEEMAPKQEEKPCPAESSPIPEPSSITEPSCPTEALPQKQEERPAPSSVTQGEPVYTARGASPRVRRISMVQEEPSAQEQASKVAEETKKPQEKQEKKKKASPKDKTKEPPQVLTVPWFLSLPWSEKKTLLRLLIQYGKRLICIVRPRQCIIHGRIGMGDPALTGEVLAHLAVVKGMLLSDIYVSGVFDQKVVEGKVFLAGKMRLISIVKETIWLALQKPIRAIIKELWKGRGERK